MNKVLIVEDEAGLVLTLSDRLESEGFSVDVARDGETGLELAMNSAYDLIVLDVMLPKRNGYDICRDIRASGNNVPVIMLTAKNETIDKVLGL
ncbi:MAG: response regulator, partial [Acidobacteriota bacterium]|nr:response regulator [Acidobacteriota bacterium]